MAADWGINQSMIRLRPAAADSEIVLFNPAFLKLIHKALVRLIRFSRDHHSGSVFVQTVYYPGSQFAANTSEISTQSQNPLDQCPGPMSGRRVDHQSSRFVYDNYIRILMKYLEAHIRIRDQFGWDRVRYFQGDFLPLFQF
jgi:hypothetical protein